MSAVVRCDRCQFLVVKTKSKKSKHTGKRYCKTLKECERKLRGDLTLAEILDLSERITASLHQ